MYSIFEEINNEFAQLNTKAVTPEAFQVIKESLKYGKVETEIVDTYYSTKDVTPIEKAKKKAKLLSEITKTKHYILNMFKNKEENFISFAYAQ